MENGDVQAKLVWVNSVRAHTQPISAVCVEGGQIVTGSLDRLLKVVVFRFLVFVAFIVFVAVPRQHVAEARIIPVL